jgi:hypothetical protein
MQGEEFYDEDFFRVLERSGARALLIGRRALVALGAPVMTTDYDLWLHIDDIVLLNDAFREVDHFPNHSADEARRRGRYVLENGQHIDVMIARSKAEPDGEVLSFDDAWANRQKVEVAPNLWVYLPSIAHLILTKRWAGRPRDLVDIDWLRVLEKVAKP